jgi:hypothetical protein
VIIHDAELPSANTNEKNSLHPSVLEKFEIPYPVSAMEINLEAFL